eukprot:m.83853 g.83853  ORF g.83853 m.83853 type:complete len:57 (+) comp12136_c0_seq1:14-184(+)
MECLHTFNKNKNQQVECASYYFQQNFYSSTSGLNVNGGGGSTSLPAVMELASIFDT